MKFPDKIITQYERLNVSHPNHAWMCRQPDGTWVVYCKHGPSWGWNHVLQKWIVCTLMDNYDRDQFSMTYEQASFVMDNVPSKGASASGQYLNMN